MRRRRLLANPAATAARAPSCPKSRRGKLTAEQLGALRELGIHWA
ncbi:hypothetical protein [Streptomyces mashuensis]|nr:hypothetical protein [Streptomyces mashuensis]